MNHVIDLSPLHYLAVSKKNLHFHNKCQQVVFLFFIAVFPKRNRKQFVLHVSIKLQGTLVKVWENSKTLWEHAAHVPTAFVVLSNFHSCFITR